MLDRFLEHRQPHQLLDRLLDAALLIGAQPLDEAHRAIAVGEEHFTQVARHVNREVRVDVGDLLGASRQQLVELCR